MLGTGSYLEPDHGAQRFVYVCVCPTTMSHVVAAPGPGRNLRGPEV